jgi:GNAT superfamily N-acetyltransferase
MHLAPLTPVAYGDLAALLTAQLAALPPGLTFDPATVAAAMGSESFWDAFYAGEPGPAYQHASLGVFAGERLVAAASAAWPDPADAGWRWGQDWRAAFPNWAVDGRSVTQVQWLAAATDQPAALEVLLAALLEGCRERGHRQLGFDSRNPFGLGWQGLPAAWTHVFDALRRVEAPGVRLEAADRWRVMTRDLTALPVAGALPPGVTLHWRSAAEAPETALTARVDGQDVAECQVWGVPPYLSGAAAWCCVEWLGVDEAQRRRGLGAYLISAQLARQTQLGKRHAALWAHVDNAPARGLYERLGFSFSAECWQVRLSLAPA